MRPSGAEPECTPDSFRVLLRPWLEFEAKIGDRNLVGHVVSHLTFSGAVTG